jgi:hypothetical protein
MVVKILNGDSGILLNRRLHERPFPRDGALSELYPERAWRGNANLSSLPVKQQSPHQGAKSGKTRN